ncbi:MAG: GMC family oxidoreductase [Gammaproteobacteria bacterium]|nr:GMC family oxidoreductase [Gammaproteobacteria bacterium]
MAEYDVCIVGSGAGGGPVAARLAAAGRAVVVLEKGSWAHEADFYKDERAMVARRAWKSGLVAEPRVLEDRNADGTWTAASTATSERDYWNGNLVGGATNFMSGYFHRLKPLDFRLRSEFGPVAGADVVDWPIAYDDLEPWYAHVEHAVGVSGRIVAHPHAEPRSTPDLPWPPTAEHPFAARIDQHCGAVGMHPFPVARAILSRPQGRRRACEYSGYCGGYGCASGAKGSARAALLDAAVAGGHCEVRPHAHVTRLLSDATGRVTAAEYRDGRGMTRQVTARLFVLAAQAIESCRLLLLSPGPRHPQGLANASGLVGRNLVFSSAALGSGEFDIDALPGAEAAALARPGPFVNRALQDWYVIDDPALGGRRKGGTLELVEPHPNALPRANGLKWDAHGKLVWGVPLQRRLVHEFRRVRRLNFEVFADWLPNPDCHVRLDPSVRDAWGVPVARVKLGYHAENAPVAAFLAARGEDALRACGASGVHSRIYDSPPPNLVAGGCRFGTDPATSVLDPDCRAHTVDNLFVTDGSFMPTGGSVPYTWTIYANAFRVAERIVDQL